MTIEPYNPLAKPNLAKSIQEEILGRAPDPLTAIDHIVGAGVYAIYYVGDFPAYAQLKAGNIGGQFKHPIYVGKAIPKGGRKGGLSHDSAEGDRLRARLREHTRSIAETSNLAIEDFYIRHLVVDDIWIPLGENSLIESFRPLWNIAIDGFGNNAAGVGRNKQVKSPWDTLHPGRKRALVLPDSPADSAFFEKRVSDHLAGRPLDPLPKVLREQEEASEDAAVEAADEA